MIDLTKEQIQKILNKKARLENGIDEILKIALNAIMHAERESYLKRNKNPITKQMSIVLSRLMGMVDNLALAIRRDRLGVFKPLYL